MTALHEEQFGVYPHERLVGHLHRRDDFTRFVFAEGYWNDPDRAVLGLRFEEDPHARHQSKMRLPPWFSNLLPEGRLRDWIATARHTSIRREMELLAQVGHDLPGAVRVLPNSDIVPVDLSGIDSLGAAPSDTPGGLWSFSLAGVGLKFSMLAQGDRLTVPGVGEGGDWILKLPDPVHPKVPHNEYAMMMLAGAVGIEVPEVRLLYRSSNSKFADPPLPGFSRATPPQRTLRARRRSKPQRGDTYQPRATPWVLVSSSSSPEGA